MKPSSGSVTRVHPRRHKKRTDPKGDRFHLKGVRWRFPRGLGAAEVDSRIHRIRQLWVDHEQFKVSSCFADPGVASHVDEVVLRDAMLQGEIGKRDTPNSPQEPAKSRQTLSDESQPDHAVTTLRSYRDRTRLRLGLSDQPSQDTWSPLALWIADQIRQGTQPIPLPPWNTLLTSILLEGKVEVRFRGLGNILSSAHVDASFRTELLDPVDALSLLRSLTEAYPSVPWAMHDHHLQRIVSLHRRRAHESLAAIKELKPESPAPADALAAFDNGTFHEAVRGYLEKRKKDFTKGGSFDGSGHHMMGLARNFLKRQPDVPLSKLDFSGCQEIYDFWLNRPENTKNGVPLSAKHCSSHIGELDRFFTWLHTTNTFPWRRPADFDLLDRKVKRLDSDRRSLQSIELKTFGVDHLSVLYRNALPSERLILTWCLNCSHGAAEVGRVEWQDLYLSQPHPWISEGLDIAPNSEDSWCGLLRPKTDVIGWWWLWPETVQLVKWWQSKLQSELPRELTPNDRMLLTRSGSPFYRDSSRNAQTSFANQWRRLLNRVSKVEGEKTVPQLPFGTLRDQMSNWLGSGENQAVLASTALAHGVPHKGDKLLYRHYSNRPWARFFEKQKEFRAVLQPMFDAAPDPLAANTV